LSGGAAGKWQSTSRIRDVGQTRELNAKNRNGGGGKKENLQENTKRFQHCDAVATKIKCTIDREGNRDGERDRQAEPFGILIYPFTDFSSHFVCKMRQSNYSTTTSMAKKRKNLQWGATTMEATKVKPHAFIHSVYSFSCSSFLSLQHSA